MYSETYLTTLRSFIILRPGDGFSSFVKITVLFFWGGVKIKCNEAFRGVYNTRKNVKSSLVLVVVLVLVSKGLK